jgi:hypothetical protein
MNILETLKSINAVQIKHSEKHAGGFERPFFDIAPDWLRQAFDSKKLKMYISHELDYMCWTIDNEYGQPIIFYPNDYIVHDGNGKIYGLESEIVDILNGNL